MKILLRCTDPCILKSDAFFVYCVTNSASDVFMLSVETHSFFWGSQQWDLMDAVIHITIRSVPVFPLSAIVCCSLKRTIHWYTIFVFCHGYVLHEGITYKTRVQRTSQMMSRFLRYTVAAVRAHNVLCNSYNTRPLLCARITCYVTVITVEVNHCSFRRICFALLYIVIRSKIV
jgi:hypothetical protein